MTKQQKKPNPLKSALPLTVTETASIPVVVIGHVVAKNVSTPEENRMKIGAISNMPARSGGIGVLHHTFILPNRVWKTTLLPLQNRHHHQPLKGRYEYEITAVAETMPNGL